MNRKKGSESIVDIGDITGNGVSEDIDRELHKTGAQPSRTQPCQSAQQVAAVPSKCGPQRGPSRACLALGYEFGYRESIL